MRSIGKVNIRKLRKIVEEEHAKGEASVNERIRERIPAEWYDSWESAYSEIERLIDDMLSEIRYK